MNLFKELEATKSAKRGKSQNAIKLFLRENHLCDFFFIFYFFCRTHSLLDKGRTPAKFGRPQGKTGNTIDCHYLCAINIFIRGNCHAN